MSQVIRNRQTPLELDHLYAPIRDELGQVEDVLRAELTSDYPFLDRMAKHGFRLGGKRLRPALVLLSGKACGCSGREHLLLAAAMELIHTATLIHDDVLDEATLRRHLETINARWDNEASVLLGDYLLTLAIRLISSLDTVYASRVVGEASRATCVGELRQVATRGVYDLSEEDYLDVIGDKTAALCSCCCRLGAHYAGVDADTEEAMARYGNSLGVAFQIVDDVLDVQGDEATTGKSLGTDVLKQKPTLPVIRLLSQLDAHERAEVLDILARRDDGCLTALRPYLDRSDAIAYCRQKAMAFICRAADELDLLPPSPAADSLRGLAEFVVTRQQ
jgi:octaprenyl-diphosphate synthase